jgi:hypothetical protein
MGGSTGTAPGSRGGGIARHFLALATAGALLLGACADRPTTPLPRVSAGALVLGPERGFVPDPPPPDWFIVAPRPGALAAAEIDNVPVLQIDAPGGPLLGRRIDERVLPAPYLRWIWYLEPTLYAGGAGDGLPRGLRIVVGFKGGVPGGAQLLDRIAWLKALPPHDRAIELRLGGLGAARPENAMVEFAVVDDRGVKRVLRPSAAGQAGRWHTEMIDLPALYSSFWPRDRLNEVEISFVAVGGLQHRLPEPTAGAADRMRVGYVAEILLAR